MNAVLGCAAAMIALGVTLGNTPARADYTAVVDPAQRFQTIEGWGTSLCWWAHMIGGFPDAQRHDYIDKIFDPVKGLGMNVVRYNIGGGENPSLPDSMELRARVPGYEPKEGVWDWSADANQRWVLQAARAKGANLCEAFSNSPPYWMTLSGSVTGAPDGGSNLDPADYGKFADYLTEVVKHFHDRWGVTFRTLDPLNEPASGWWKNGGRQEGCHFDPNNASGADQNALVKLVAADLRRKGLSTTVSAADENSINQTVKGLESYDDAARASLGQINTHSYSGNQREQLRDLARANAKRLWMSEYGDGDASGLTLSHRILEDMKIMQPTAWVYWQAVDGGGWGLLKRNNNTVDDYSYAVNPKYYVMGNYSKFIRPGDQIIAIGDDNSLAAYRSATGTLTIVTTNSGTADTRITYDLSRFTHLPKGATPYRTSPSEALAKLPTVAVNGKQFAAVAAAKSVTTYVLSGVR